MKKLLTSVLLLITSLCSFSQDYNSETQSATKESYLEKGYRGFVSGETIIGNMLGIIMTTTHGVQLNNKLFLGGGAGMCIANDLDNNFANFPIYVDFRADFLNKKVSPFVETKLGIEFATQGSSGLYGDLSVGCRIKRFSISFGADMMGGKYAMTHSGNYGGYSYHEYEATRAFNFVSRLGFEFK